MKIRNGFVSNSSSSSFVVVGRKVHLSDISLDDFKNKNFMIETGYYYEGSVNIHTEWFDKNELDKLYDFLTTEPDEEKQDEIYRHTLIEIFEYSNDVGELELKVGRLLDVGNLTIFYGEEDQHSPTNMNGIEELIQHGEY